MVHRWWSWPTKREQPAVAARRRWSGLGVGLVVAALLGGGLATAPTADAARPHRSLERFAASVSRVRLLDDGTVRVRVAVVCPRSAPGDLTVLRAGLVQERARADRTLSPLRCSRRGRTVTVTLASATDDAFEPGRAELSVQVGAHCPRTPVGNESICRDEASFFYPVTLRTARGSRPLPRLALSRAVLLPDGRLRVRAQLTCRVGTTDRFSILEASADQGSSGPIRTLRPAPCTGRRSTVRLTLTSGTADGYRPGPARLFMQLLSDCRVVPDDEAGSFDVCDRTTAILTTAFLR
jgi:hypothetical protein